jgi:hypothetical protein
MPPPPTPKPTPRADLEPGTGPVLSDYRIEDLRYAELGPTDGREVFYGPGLDPIVRDPAPVLDAPDAPPDWRPAVAHTAAYATRKNWPSVDDQKLGVRTRDTAPTLPALPGNEMLPPLDLQRNFARFQPGPVRDQTPYTVGAEG